ncbi:hypothetical protein AVEN_194688-1 [Araneus ventricosus]|uniref:Reverse transcriptase domain-containing protein n=1 Tax=Araneus ventricosus TaxID=182803 RepID=A0A4Y2RQJ8_ARAVE|nr:hypothetical protein AVEN_194688-1 [Araneus ventricosus]
MQRYMDSIIRDIPSCYAYVDDLLIASVDQESHKSDLDLVFSKLSEHGIVVNPQKCVFDQSELKFLGFLISSKGISPLPEKVQFLKEFPLPSARFSHVHIDVVGPLSPVRGMTYLLTCVDRFTR